MKRTQVCGRIAAGVSCPELRPCPVAGHERDPNASWSPDRDRGQQRRFRDAVLERDGRRCTRCGEDERTVKARDDRLEAHHVRNGYDVSAGVTLCGECHRIVDPHAR